MYNKIDLKIAPSGAEKVMILVNYVNIMAGDALVPWAAMLSIAMILVV